MNKGKIRFYAIFTAFVVLFSLVKWAVPSVAHNSKETASGAATESHAQQTKESVDSTSSAKVDDGDSDRVISADCPDFHPDLACADAKKHKIFSVSSYDKCFPDVNDDQLPAARKNGVPPVENREAAEHMKGRLVYIGSSPYYHLDKLNSSIPYLVPKASKLLNDIGQAFHDSLALKHIPLHQFVVTSVTRTKEDVAKLQRHNGNATTTSCHLFGTTIDICYNRYKTVEDPDGPSRRKVRSDSLKFVLSEVLNDMRKQNRCFVKYEHKQSCFHLTVR